MLATAVFALWACIASVAAKKPNIVFILVDDTGYNDIGYNNRSTAQPPRIRTPHIDALAAAGVKLTNYYVQPICTPTRAALMTGRYPFRYGVTGRTIGAKEPWGIPLAEAFMPQFFKDAGYATAMFGKWHLGFFTPDYTPTGRGFERQSGIFNGMADHWSHKRSGGYDWHVDDKAAPQVAGRYSGNLVRDDAVRFIGEMAKEERPFFLYVPFQEAHAPFQVGRKYRRMYPELIGYPKQRNLAGMVTHNDDMVADIVGALKETGLLENTILVFSSDNGGPGGQEGVPMQKRFDETVLDRNYPFRGQKHEVYEGGVRSAGFVYSPLLPPGRAGSSVEALVHVTDWLPTLASAAGVPLSPRPHLPLDGYDLWRCILGEEAQCSRREVVMNFNTVCDDEEEKYRTECPAPKAALRAGDLKLLAECYDSAEKAFKGKLMLYNVTRDPSESKDLFKELSVTMPEAVEKLKSRLLFYGAEASKVPPLDKEPPWQGEDYYCAKCPLGEPQGPYHAWEPWCTGPAKAPCAPASEFI